MLRVQVKNETLDTCYLHGGGPFEIGRGPRRDAERCIVDDPMVSRNQLRLVEREGTQVEVANISQTNPVFVLNDGSRIEMGSSRQLTPPLTLCVGSTTVLVDFGKQAPEIAEQTMRLDDRKLDQSLTKIGVVPSAEMLAQWLQTALELQQDAADLPSLYDRTALSLVEMMGMDLGAVYLRSGPSWKLAAERRQLGIGEVSHGELELERLSHEKRTFYVNPDRSSDTDEVAVVVSPIWSVARELTGALLGMKVVSPLHRHPRISKLEAQLVQLFASAASTQQAKTEAIRIRTQFEQFFSPQLAEQLQQNPRLLEGGIQEVTILVSDLRGFSRLSERLGPQQTCELMRDVMDRFTECILDAGGAIVDYAGDGILAMWNAPVPQADHAARACRAALAMVDELPDLNEKWNAAAGGRLRAGIGINTGQAMIGNTGSSRRLKYGPHGNTVNLASRVQDATKKLRIPLLITGSTREQLPPEFASRRLCKARVEGIQGPVVLHELHGPDAHPEWLRRRDAYESALADYESGNWGLACQKLVGLVELGEADDGIDLPTIKLIRNAWDCLESREPLDPVIDL